MMLLYATWRSAMAGVRNAARSSGRATLLIISPEKYALKTTHSRLLYCIFYCCQYSRRQRRGDLRKASRILSAQFLRDAPRQFLIEHFLLRQTAVRHRYSA